MYYEHYLFGDQDRKIAFIQGWRALRGILMLHAASDYTEILSCDDEDWILHICTAESEHSEQKRQAIAHSILQHYNINRAELRGMLLDCFAINDDGQEVNENGTPCTEHQPYPNKFYRDYYSGKELTAKQFAHQPPEAQTLYDEVPYITLTHRNHTGRRVDLHNHSYMTEILTKVIPDEPRAVLELYYQMLKTDTPTAAFQQYGELIAGLMMYNREILFVINAHAAKTD